MVEQIGAVIERVLDPATRPKPERQPSLEFWKDFNEDLKAAKTPEEKDAVWRRYAEAKTDFRPNRRQRRGSTLDPVKYRALTREQRARLIFLAERMDGYYLRHYKTVSTVSGSLFSLRLIEAWNTSRNLNNMCGLELNSSDAALIRKCLPMKR